VIKRKKKRCLGCNTDQFLYGHQLCNRCYSKKKREEKKLKPPKKKAPLKKVSDKQKEKNEEYKAVRLEFLLEKDHCEVAGEGCLAPYPIINPTEVLTVHHKAGRSGTFLTDKRYFLACCIVCHRKIEEFPKWAKDNGYSIPRLNNN